MAATVSGLTPGHGNNVSTGKRAEWKPLCKIKSTFLSYLSRFPLISLGQTHSTCPCLNQCLERRTRPCRWQILIFSLLLKDTASEKGEPNQGSVSREGWFKLTHQQASVTALVTFHYTDSLFSQMAQVHGQQWTIACGRPKTKRAGLLRT